MRCSTLTSMALVASSRIEDRRVDQQGPGDGDALALAARQRVAALADDRVVALGQAA